MSKITDEDIYNLLSKLNKVALDVDPWKFGLPYWEGEENCTTDLQLKCVVRDWLDQHNLVVSEREV